MMGGRRDLCRPTFNCLSVVFNSLLVICVFTSHSLFSAVVINEIYYDHTGSDDGYEFIEIYNSSNEFVDISGYNIEFVDGKSKKSYILWEGVPGIEIEPYGFILIGGVAYGLEDDFTLRHPIENGPDAILLNSPSGLLDLVGYGQLDDPDLYEGEPAIDTRSGFSLSRRPDGFDSGSNAGDFVETIPTPGARNFFDHDVALSIPSELVVCQSGSLEFEIELYNKGLLPFHSLVFINVTVDLMSGNEILSFNRRIDITLDVEEKSSVVLTEYIPPGIHDSVLSLTCSLLSSVDENHSNDTVATYVGVLPSEIVINEIMYRPSPGSCEWMELYNRGCMDVDLKGWMISDATGKKRIVTSVSTAIPPGGFFILCEDSSLFTKQFGNVGCGVMEPEGGWPSLNDYSSNGVVDEVTIYDRACIIKDKVGYGEIVSSERGRSIERVSVDLCGCGKGEIWERCLSEKFSTPGRKNSVYTEEEDIKGQIVELYPNPFMPGREKLSVYIRCEGFNGSLMVEVYDLNGFLVRRLFSDRCNNNLYRCFWDGRGETGMMVKEGLYICVVRFICPGGGDCGVVKQGVVVSQDL